jgi:DNA processing protein
MTLGGGILFRVIASYDGDAELPLFGTCEASAASAGEAAEELETADGLAALLALPKIGAARAIRLAETFRTWDRLLNASAGALRSAAGAPVEVHRVDRPAVPEGTHLVGWFDEDYPPAVLWVKGVLAPVAPRIAIVGSRNPTPWGEGVATLVAREAAARGIEVVSGLALGIDIAAHRACVDASGTTIAILGSGVDRVTPPQHREDAARILESGGAVVAEVTPGTNPSARTLVARNRLQSGLSSVTLIAQSGVTSGTVQTARFAVEQGRVLAVAVPLPAEANHEANGGNQAMLNPVGTDDFPHAAFALGSKDEATALLDLVAT